MMRIEGDWWVKGGRVTEPSGIKVFAKLANGGDYYIQSIAEFEAYANQCLAGNNSVEAFLEKWNSRGYG